MISSNGLIDSIFTSSSKMRRRMIYGEGLTGGNGGQGNLVHLRLVHLFEEEEEETLCDGHPLARILLLPHVCKNKKPQELHLDSLQYV